MSGRLTRAHRREIESKTHQKINLDDLAKFEPDDFVSDVSNAHPAEKTKEIEAQQKNEKQKSNATKEENLNKQQEESSKEESSEEDSSQEDSSDSSSDSSEDDEEEDEDLDALLAKAQEALASQAASIALEKSSSDKINTKLSKMDLGISVENELYLKKAGGRAKLIPDAVALVDDGEKASAKATVVLKPSKDEKKLNKKERQAEREKTTGKAWFDMPKTEMTDQVKRDLQVLKMRHILDRKRHYKKMGKRPDPKYFQIGTVIESPTEFFSARINKKDRKQTIVDELMANDELKQYYKRKHIEVQEKTSSGGKKHYKKLKTQRQWAK
ncbi:Fcf2 pre-rRNA processing-domain-containing protein [Parasitella parasitica]|nr:Fcf2 pre-rRNA processing-domain-containing protein [Parasitella parasitica]